MLLEWVENGEEVLITRHGKPVARLVSVSPGSFNRDKARQAARNLREARRGVTLGGLIKNLVNEGRS